MSYCSFKNNGSEFWDLKTNDKLGIKVTKINYLHGFKGMTSR
jgi:hypothetical protein